MELLETPAERFEGLPDFPFEPRFVEVDPRGVRMAHLDEGPRDGPLVLMLHGEPSWSYLYRFMIPRCVDAGCRVIAPDLVGFGRSSKPARVEDHSYRAHCEWVRALLEELDLRDITLFGQDWGSLIGLRLAAELEPRFSAAVIGNGFLPDGGLGAPGPRAFANVGAFMAWRTFARVSPWFRPGRIVAFGTGRRLSPEEVRAYDAPFPDKRYLAGPRAMPRLVPITPRDPEVPAQRAAWEVLERWDKPFVTAFSSGDPITRGLDRLLQRRIPGAAGQSHHTVRGGHFLQEDAGAELGDIVAQVAQRAG